MFSEIKFVCGNCDIENVFNSEEIRKVMVRVSKNETTIFYPCKKCGAFNALLAWGNQPICDNSDSKN